MKIYFAGPNVFHPKAKEMELLITNYCRTLGVTPLIPGDSGIDWANPDLPTIARQIFTINRDHIINCDAVIANTTPFRGACIDDGTAWEIGFAAALDKPIVTYASGSAKTGETIEKFSSISSEDDLKSNLREQLEKLNEFTFSDAEWAYLLSACQTANLQLRAPSLPSAKTSPTPFVLFQRRSEFCQACHTTSEAFSVCSRYLLTLSFSVSSVCRCAAMALSSSSLLRCS